MKDKWFQWYENNTPFSAFLGLLVMAIIAAIIGIILCYYIGNCGRQYRNSYRTFEDYQYQQYLDKDF